MAQTLYDKIWQAHDVGQRADGNSLLYIDLQLLHEVTSPQAFEGLQLADRPLWRVNANRRPLITMYRPLTATRALPASPTK